MLRRCLQAHRVGASVCVRVRAGVCMRAEEKNRLVERCYS